MTLYESHLRHVTWIVDTFIRPEETFTAGDIRSRMWTKNRLSNREIGSILKGMPNVERPDKRKNQHLWIKLY